MSLSVLIKNILSFVTEDKKKSNLDMDFDDIIDCSEKLEMYI
jgi:tRNA A37 threonylcarbamoyladenosine dehydratase